MKMQLYRKRACFSFAIIVAFLALFAMKGSVHAGVVDQIKEKVLLLQLVGEGQFVGYQRNVDTKDPLFPIEVVNDGFKMVRVYQNFPGNYLVEWSWRVLLKNRSSHAVKINFEYKLRDQDSFLLTSSSESFQKIAAGQTLAIEKTDFLPYETAERVAIGDWYVHILN